MNRRTLTAAATVPEGALGTGTASTSVDFGNNAIDISGGDITEFDKYRVNQYRNVWVAVMGSLKKGKIIGILRRSDSDFTVLTDSDMTGVAGEAFRVVVADLTKAVFMNNGAAASIDGSLLGAGREMTFELPATVTQPENIDMILVHSAASLVVTEFP